MTQNKTSKAAEAYMRFMHATELIMMYPVQCNQEFLPVCRNHIYRLLNAGVGYDEISQRISDLRHLASLARRPFIPYPNVFFRSKDTVTNPMQWRKWVGDGMDEKEWKLCLQGSGVNP